MPDFQAHDTGPGSAAQGGEVHARSVAGRDVVNLPPQIDAVMYEQISILNRVDERTANTDARVEKLEAQVKKMGEIMLGNGERGTLETVRAIQEDNRRFRTEARILLIGLIIWCITLTVLYIGVV